MRGAARVVNMDLGRLHLLNRAFGVNFANKCPQMLAVICPHSPTQNSVVFGLCSADVAV